jgi:predicted nucleic acid-binding protein
MPRPGRRYALDTNVFIRAARDRGWHEQLERFHAAFAPFEVLAAVVAQELLAGVRKADAKTLERSLIEPFERRDRLITPSWSAWRETGRVLGELALGPSLTRSIVNDLLLAMSCREAGVVLVTENTRDFERIAKVRPFEFVAPWPVPAS